MQSPYVPIRAAAGLTFIALFTHISLAVADDMTETRHFDVGAPPFLDLVPLTVSAAAEDVSIGGVTFPARPPFAPQSVAIHHPFMTEVEFVVCQDVDADKICGEDGEPRVDECSLYVPLVVSAIPFSAERDTHVIVRALHGGVCRYVGFTISGDITIEYDS